MSTILQYLSVFGISSLVDFCVLLYIVLSLLLSQTYIIAIALLSHRIIVRVYHNVIVSQSIIVSFLIFMFHVLVVPFSCEYCMVFLLPRPRLYRPY